MTMTMETAAAARFHAEPIGSAYRIQPMTADDVAAVVAFMRRYPEVHFCEWEDETLLAQAISRQRPSSSFVCRDGDGAVLGAVIAGSVGVRGTISHVAVAPEARRRGIATRMVRRSLAAFREAGIRRVFLFVVADAASGRAFWEAQGFRETRGESTLEADL